MPLDEGYFNRGLSRANHATNSTRRRTKGNSVCEAGEGVPRPSRREGVQRVIGVGCKTTAAGEGRGGGRGRERGREGGEG